MASLIQNRSRQYRQRAEEARARAEAATDRGIRQSLLQIAETWERMADYEEKHPVFAGLYGNPPENRQEPDQPSD